MRCEPGPQLKYFHSRFAAYKKWKFEALNINRSDQGGIKVDFNVTVEKRGFPK